jgi:DNA invertase Pin-like site-specific DNA recombinase
MRVIGYARTSTDEQTNGMEHQVAMLRAEAAKRGWGIQIVEEHASGKTLARRPLLTDVLLRLDAHKADALLVTKLDRLARSMLDFVAVLERSRKKKWALISLDLGLDTSTPVGEFSANTLMAVAQLERQLIAQRTREGLAAVKARGVQLGKPSTVPESTQKRITELRERDCKTWRAIASILNVENIAAPAGGNWQPMSARRVYMRNQSKAA